MKKRWGATIVLCVFVISAVSFAESLIDKHGNALIGTRTHSKTFNIGGTLEAYLVGLSEDEANSITPGSMVFLKFVKPFDAEKSGIGDLYTCAAATVANMLAYTGWGDVNGLRTADEVFAFFVAAYNTTEGIQPFFLCEWFIRGDFARNNGVLRNQDQPLIKPFDGFYPDIDSRTLRTYLRVVTVNNTSQIASTVDHMKNGCAVGVGFDYYRNSTRSGTHTVTLWGIVYDSSKLPTANDYYVGLLISDSDDRIWNPNQRVSVGKGGASAPNELKYVSINWNHSKEWYDTNYRSPADGTRVGVLRSFTILAPPPDRHKSDIGGVDITPSNSPLTDSTRGINPKTRQPLRSWTNPDLIESNLGTRQ